jgi:glycerophosphoryl diester phosphodiesterase
MKSKIGRLLLIILGVVAVILVLSWLPGRRADYMAYYADAPQPLVIAHQGGDGLWPGDTLYAFQHAVDLGADVLQMDLHTTRDGVLVLMHDETVDRTTDGTGDISAFTLDEIKKLDAGYDWSPDGGKTFPYRGTGITVPSLEEVLNAFPEKRMVIEMKKSGVSLPQPLCNLIHEHKMEARVMIAGFNDAVMEQFRTACPEVATSAAQTETSWFVFFSKVGMGFVISPAYQSLQVPEEGSDITVMTAQLARAAHRRNLQVEPWTINDPDKMRQYLDWGVDGIITDRPDLMLEVLGR